MRMATKPIAEPNDPRGKVAVEQRFGLLTVKRFVGVTPVYRKHVWEAACDCGCVVVVKSQELLRGDTRSCGCLHRAATISRNKASKKYHERHADLVSLASAIDRCHNPRSKDFHRYGALGIHVFEGWRKDRQTFLDYVPPRTEGTTLDRIDPTKGYEPGNVRWATSKEQADNRRTTKMVTENGLTMSLSDWGRHLGVSQSCVSQRYHQHGSVYGGNTRRKGKGPDQEAATR